MYHVAVGNEMVYVCDDNNVTSTVYFNSFSKGMLAGFSDEGEAFSCSIDYQRSIKLG
jgi:lipid-binding SYLF domain-containing protein